MSDTRIHILLVDDHPLVRDGLRMRLEMASNLCVVAEAGSGAEAIARARQGGIDLVLMDINLRGSSGIDATAQLGTHCPGVAVLILSMHDKLEYVSQAMAAGARGYVLKDAPADEVLNAIATVMAGGIYYSAALALRLQQLAPQDKGLTFREQQVLDAIASGYANKQIARSLHLSVRTVETHRLNIKRKLGIGGQAELIRFAVLQTRSGDNPD